MNPAKNGVDWWNAERAALYLGFVKWEVRDGVVIGTPAMGAWKSYYYRDIERTEPVTHWLLGRMRFRQAELEPLIERAAAHQQQAEPLRGIAGGKR